MKQTKQHSAKPALAVAGWLAVIVPALLLLAAYANSPGAAGAPPARWPEASRVPRESGRPALVMFVHPHCPCSRASLGELALLMARCHGRLQAHVLFLRPENLPEDWARTDLWATAAAIPGVTARRDDAGREARLFHSVTSGDAALYDAQGRLLFHGGLTPARGHAGDNPGRSALENLLLRGSTPQITTPVFGCPLFGSAAECSQPEKPCHR